LLRSTELFFMSSTLAINWLPFLISVLLLWLPITVLFGKTVQYRELESAWGRFAPKAATLPWHWIDALRAAAAAFFLCEAVGFSRAIAESEPSNLEASLVVAAVLAVGVILQTVVCRADNGFHTPFAYVFGVCAVLFPPAPAALALVVAVTAAIGFRTLAAFLWVLPMSLVAIGAGLYPHWVELSLGAGFSLLAAILPMLFHRHFVFAHRTVPPDPEMLRDLR
jgi:hypothetical protein